MTSDGFRVGQCLKTVEIRCVIRFEAHPADQATCGLEDGGED
jgi:hypothetical protein